VAGTDGARKGVAARRGVPAAEENSEMTQVTKDKPSPTPQARREQLGAAGSQPLVPNGAGQPSIVPDDLSDIKLKAIEAASRGMIITDREGNILWANGAMQRLTGYSLEEIVGQNPRLFSSSQQPSSYYEKLWQTILAGEEWQGDLINRRKDGQLYVEHMAITPVRAANGEVAHFIAIKEDITTKRHEHERARLFAWAVENSWELISLSDTEGRLTYANPAALRFVGRTAEEAIGKHISVFLSPNNPPSLLEEVSRKTREEGGWRGENLMINAEGKESIVEFTTSRVTDASGQVVGTVAVSHDITQRKAAEAQLREAQEKLNLALEDAEQRARLGEKLTELVDLIQCCQTDEQAYQIAQDALAAIFESSEGALCLTASSRDIVETVAVWGDNLATERAFSPGDCWALRRGKTHVVNDVDSAVRCAHVHAGLTGGHVCVPLAAQGETLGLLYMQCREKGLAAENKAPDAAMAELAHGATLVGERLSLALANLKLREVLRHQSVRDPLTGLFNRRYMEETLDRELSRASRRNEAVAVAMCDLDHFKQFNDTFGHEAGDLVLREVAATLQKNVRQGDIVCRFGGEELVLIFPEATAEIATERAEFLREQVKALALSYRGRTLGKITISIGIAMYPEDGVSFEGLIRASDQALYRAKADGRDRVVLSCPVH
jgi:diguanylate cyclase (GGDEF)-like protein/PAS domain S-box-containing protein